MSYTFERPVGAAADARELEYVAALHQTKDDDDDDWMDGSIEATDVKNFLFSRYGIKVTKQEVRDLIFADMGGGDECIDLTEVVAILIIPFLSKIDFFSGIDQADLFEENKYQSQFEMDALQKAMILKKTMVEDKIILADILKVILKGATKSSSLSQPLTRDLLRRIFAHYGERDLLKDDVFIDEMIEAAAVGESNPVLDVDTFIRALTHDIKLYDVTNESRFQTHYEDVFGLRTDEKEKESSNMERNDAEIKEYDLAKTQVNRTVNRMFTFSQIDFLADTFSSRSQYMFAWLAVVISYIAYVFGTEGIAQIQVCPEEKRGNFGCQIGRSIVIWFAVMASTIFLIAPSVMVLNLGNNVYHHSMIEIMVGIIGIIILVILPSIIEFDWKVITTTDIEDAEYVSEIFDVVILTIGCILLFMQISNIVRFVVPDSNLTKSKALTILLRGSSVRSEFGTKQASVFKVHQMVKNAYDLHKTEPNKEMIESGEENVDALLNFTKVTDKRETCGGLCGPGKCFYPAD